MKKVILGISIIIFVATLFTSLRYEVVSAARIQNKYNLDSTVYCVNQILKEKGKTSKYLTSALNICAKKQRSLGITGDMFVIRTSDKKLFWDASSDCKPEKESKLFMIKDGVCSLFEDSQSCVDATDYMVNNPPKGGLTWNFDDSTEILNYKYLPEINGKKYILGQGSQTDEDNSIFIIEYLIMFVGGFILLLILIT